MTMKPIPGSQWQLLVPGRATALTDARLQLHHAAQLATAAGISFLKPLSDDSHTNLEWLPPLEALASRVIPAPSPFRIAVRPSSLTLLLLDGDAHVLQTFPLHGHTIAEGARWLSDSITTLGADPRRFTLRRHYEIPPHPLGAGARFDLTCAPDFAELSYWFANADASLRALADSTDEASEVRCWPHHFDIATLLTLPPARDGSSRSIGVGMEPGDEHYEQPYLYVNLSPKPRTESLPTLVGGGHWHTRDWIGAVLPGSRLPPAAMDQRDQCSTFIESAIDGCRVLLEAS